jgi:hypothetical protein
MYHVVHDDPPPLSSVRPGLPLALDGLLATALAKDPAERYADGRAFAEAIGAVPGIHLPAATSNAAVSTATPECLGSTQVLPRSPTASRNRSRRLVLGLAPVSAFAAFSLNSNSGSTPTLVTVPVTASIAVPIALASPAALAVASEAAPAPPVNAASLVAPLLAGAPLALPERPAQLALTIEHSVKDGRPRLWIDNGLELDSPLARKETRKVLFLKRRSDKLARVLVLAPGQRSLRFEVKGDDGTRSKSLVGEFKSGEGRSLQVKVGGTIETEWLPWAGRR